MAISYSDFEKVEINVGKIISVEDNIPGAKKQYYRLTVDFGPKIGIKQSAAQITEHYKREDLVGRQVIAVTNFEPKKIVDFMSEVLVLGVHDNEGRVILLKPDFAVPLGARMR